MTPTSEFLYALLGASFPEIYRIYRAYGAAKPPTYQKSFIIVSIVFFIASAIIASALPGVLEPLAAVYAGASAPLIMSKATAMLEPILPSERLTSAGPVNGDLSGPKAVIDTTTTGPSTAKYILTPSRSLRPMSGLYSYVTIL